MTDPSLLGPWVRRFLLEYLVGERNLARNTQQSYRDTLRLLLPFVARRAGKPVDRLGVEDLSADGVRAFLQEVEEQRKCGVSWCGEVRTVPFKKAPRSPVTYLEKAEMDALLATPDPSTSQGRRDHAVLLF